MDSTHVLYLPTLFGSLMLTLVICLFLFRVSWSIAFYIDNRLKELARPRRFPARRVGESTTEVAKPTLWTRVMAWLGIIGAFITVTAAIITGHADLLGVL